MSQNLPANPVAQMLAGIKANLAPSFQFQPGDSLSDGIGSSYGVIHYRGRIWSLSYRSQSYLFVRPDDGTPASYIDVIVLRQAKNKSKSLYDAFDQDAMNKRPVCSSIDGERPDADAQQPQSATCGLCPRNVWKTDANGKRGKDCSDYKRVAVLLMPNVSARLLNGPPLMEPVFLRVPAASLSDLASYGDQLNSAGLPYFGIVTRISFDPTKSHPQMQFRPLQGLTEAEAPVVLPLREDNVTKRIVGEDRPAQQALAAPQPVFAPPVAAAPPAQQPILIHQPPQQFVAPQVIPPPVNPQPLYMNPKLPEPTTIDTGFVDLGRHVPATPAPQAPVQAQAPLSDVGQPEESDAALDARLAALLPSV